MHHFRGDRDSRKSIASSRRLWTALRALNKYLTGQSAWLVNYAERHRAGLRVGTAITEGTANFLVNRRMTKVSKCGGHGAARTCCFRFGVRYITERSVLSMDRDSIQPTTLSHQSQLPPDPQFCTNPIDTLSPRFRLTPAKRTKRLS